MLTLNLILHVMLPGIIPLFWGLALCFSLTSIGFIAFVLVSRKRKNRYAIQVQEMSAKCQPFLTELAFEGTIPEEFVEFEQQMKSTNSGKRIILNELIKIRKYFQGEAASSIEHYYIENQLYKLSINKLYSRRQHKKIVGIYEIMDMNYQGATRSLLQFIHKEKNPELVTNALIALTKLDYKLGLHKISEQSIYLSDWFQLQVLKILDEIKVPEIPPLEKWVNKSTSHALMGIRLLIFLRAMDQVEDLSSLLNHENDRIRLETIKAFRTIQYDEISFTLIQKYYHEPIRNKCEIIRTLEVLNHKQNLAFIKLCTKSKDNEVQRAAKEALVRLIPMKPIPGVTAPIIQLFAHSLQKAV